MLMPNQYVNKTLESPIYLGASTTLFSLAKELRKNMTLAEKLLWKKIKTKQIHGLKFRRQHPILRFIVDFYCHEKRLVIEVDGGYHQEMEQQEYDLGRSQELEQFGIRVIRFKNYEIEEDIDFVIRKIEGFLDNDA